MSEVRTPSDMTTGKQWKFRVGDLRYLETCLDKLPLDGAIDGLAALHMARKQVAMLSQQMTVQLRLNDGTVTEDTEVYLHSMTYDELRMAWLHLSSAANMVAKTMDWISTGEGPLKPEETASDV